MQMDIVTNMTMNQMADVIKITTHHKLGLNLGSNPQIQQAHTPLNVFTTTIINFHTQKNNPMPPISQILVFLK